MKRTFCLYVVFVIKSSWRIECNICDESFTSKISLNRHIVSVHEGKKPFKCAICDTSLSENSYFSRHIEAVHNYYGKPNLLWGKPSVFFQNRRFSNPIILLEKPSVLVQNRRKYKLSNKIKTEGFSRKTFCFFFKKTEKN